MSASYQSFWEKAWKAFWISIINTLFEKDGIEPQASFSGLPDEKNGHVFYATRF